MASESRGGERGTRILYVDGSASALDAVRDTLDHDVHAVTSAAAAIDAVEADGDGFDVIVSEYDLPDAPAADGGARSLYADFATTAPDTPVVVYTDAGDETVAGRAVAAGVAGYVPKAAGPTVLADRLSGVLTGTTPAASASASSTRHSPAADGNGGVRPWDTTAVETTGDDGDDETTASATQAAGADPETIVDEAPLALVEVDADGDIVRWNEGAEALFGYDEATALGRNLIEFLVPEAEQAAVEAVAERALSPHGITTNVNQNVRRDGSVITCEWHTSAITGEDGSVQSAVALVHDVTARENRKETIEQLRSVTRELVRADSERRIGERVVAAAEEILGQPYSAVYLADEDEALTAIAYGDGFDDPPAANAEESATWRAYHAGEARVVDDRVEAQTSLDGDTAIESVLVLPLGEHGTLSLGSEEPNGFDDTDVQLSNILASATTAALDRTRREHDLQLHEAIVDAVGAGVFALDGDGVIETVNDTLCDLTGYDRDSLVGAHATTLVDDETYARATEQVRALAPTGERHGEVLTFEVDIVAADGTRIPCEVNCAVLNEHDESRGMAGVVRDVRERKRMESELGEKRQKIENLHDIASLLDDCETRDAVWELTVEAAEGVLDFDVCGVDEVRGEYLHSVGLSSEIEPEGYKQQAHVSDGLAGKTYRTGESFRVDDIQGDNEATPEKRTYSALISVPIGDHGVFQAVSDEVGAFDADDLELAELLMRHVANAIDRIEFESRLRGERDRFAALFENVPDPVVQTRHTEAGTIVEDVNPAFERVFGYGPDDIVGGDLNDFVVPVDRRTEAEHIDNEGKAGRVVEREVKRRTTDGLRDFELTAVPVDADADEPLTFFVYSDITERKERQKRVEILNRVLRHDLRNGMNIIKGSAEMLQDAVADTTAIGYADQVIERADDLLSLAEKTRAVERTLDRDSEATGPVNVRDSVETSAARVRTEYPEAQIDVDVQADVSVRADDMLRTAIYHLLENAVQHHDAPSPHVTVSANRAPADDTMLRIEVRDDGPGIPDAERELIEEEQEITQLRHASGLGLWLVDWVVNQSGGDISFEANDPRGTVVTLHVPIATEAEYVPVDD